jgi:glycosyltransferase involved in cell wall biosynthesis
MKLSIIIPTYNVVEYIDECLQSLLPQLTDECELIIVDDCSTDGTKEKIFGYLTHEMASKYFQYKDGEKNFKFYMHETNKGVSAARNVGLKVATGEHIAFIDGDDLVSNNYIKQIFEAIKKEKDAYKLSWERFNLEPDTFFSKHLPEWNCSIWCIIWKRNKIEHMFDETLKIAEDKKFREENIQEDWTWGYIDEPIYKYRGGRLGSLSNEN